MCSFATSSSLLLSSFFSPPAPTEIYTLSLHDALPISLQRHSLEFHGNVRWIRGVDLYLELLPGNSHLERRLISEEAGRSEEHTSELQSTWPSRMPSSA